MDTRRVSDPVINNVRGVEHERFATESNRASGQDESLAEGLDHERRQSSAKAYSHAYTYSLRHVWLICVHKCCSSRT